VPPPLNDFLLNRVFFEINHFNENKTVQFSGPVRAGFLGTAEWSSEGEIGQPEAMVNVFRFYVEEIRR